MIKRIVEGAAIVFLGLAAFFFFKSYTANKELAVAKETFKADKEKLQNEITNLIEEKDHYKREALKANADAQKSKDEVKVLKGDLVTAKNETKLWASKIEKMSDDDVIVDTRKVLEVDEKEIWKNSSGVQFSFSATRKVYQKLMEWQDFTLVTVPAYDRIIDGEEKVIDEQDTAFQNMSVALSKCELSLVKYGQLQVKYDSLLDVYERSNRWLKITVGTTVVAIVVVGGLLLFGR